MIWSAIAAYFCIPDRFQILSMIRSWIKSVWCRDFDSNYVSISHTLVDSTERSLSQNLYTKVINQPLMLDENPKLVSDKKKLQKR